MYLVTTVDKVYVKVDGGIEIPCKDEEEAIEVMEQIRQSWNY